MKRILFFSLTLFFLKLADGIFTFWAPIQIQTSLNSSALMGLVISSQSIMGLTLDLIFPKLLGNFKTRSLIFWSLIATGIASIILFGTTFWPYVILFLVSMFAWAVYYELASFGNYQFVATSVEPNLRSNAWGIINVFKNIAFFIGPLLASFVLIKSPMALEIIILIVLGIGLISFLATGKINEVQREIVLEKINPLIEMTHWFSLIKTVWPAIIMSLLMGFVDATYWTVGAVWAERIIRTNYLGGFLIPAYELPFLFMGLLLLKFGVTKGKKILSEKLLIIVGIFLFLMKFNMNLEWQILMIFLSSCLLAFTYPLLDGVYSDLIARMGKEKKDMIGLTSATINLSYIIWPVIAGILTSKVGESMTFSYLGILIVFVSVILLFVTPKKLRLPQGEIKSWG